MYGIYVHVPFCLKRCPYCAFVLTASDGSLHGPFVEKVCGEIRAAAKPARTLYFGGGTPSLLTPAELGRIMEAVGGSPEEVTVECNPESFDPEGMKGIGVTRLTLGIQALDDGHLKMLGREHDAAGAREAWRRASAHFDNICVDLIFGIPGQTLEGWRKTLAEVRSWKPAHVSLYGLTFEIGTPFEKIKDRMAPESERALYEEAMTALSDYRHYEISNFALPGFESLHNRAYWERRPYLGFGPGAHSYEPEERWWNISNVREYLRSERAEMRRERLTDDQIRIERIMLGLRQDVGVELDRVPEGLEAYVERENGKVKLTRAGRCVADSVIAKLI